MKTITCLDCEERFTGATPEEIMEAMMPHYMDVHSDLMNEGDDGLRDGWFVELNQRFDEAPLDLI